MWRKHTAKHDGASMAHDKNRGRKGAAAMNEDDVAIKGVAGGGKRGARDLGPGDRVSIDWELNGRETTYTITARMVCNGPGEQKCQSGVMFRVQPPLRLRGPDDWIDSDWFAPCPARP